MPRIFISYRRDDSRTITGRIYDRLSSQFGKENVFRDLDGIALGSDFRRVIEREVSSCDFLLAIIGSHWVTITDGQGRKRIDDPSDFVRLEVEAALRLPNVTVIPVYVDGVRGISTGDLPPTLADLPYRNAAVVRDDPDFHGDVDKLIGAIKRLVPVSETLPVSPAPRVRVNPKLLVGLLVFILLIVVIIVSISLQRQPTISELQESNMPQTETRLLNVNTTATQISLQLTVDSQILTNISLFKTSTQIAKDFMAFPITGTPIPAAATDTPVPTAPPQPTSTVTINYQLDETATQIMLQRTADAKAATNEALFAESTSIVETAKPRSTNTQTFSTSTATATPTLVAKGFPCEGTIMSSNSDATTLTGVIYSRPTTSSTALAVLIQVGEQVTIAQKSVTNQQTWFQLVTKTGGIIGWISSRYLTVSMTCP